jgi:hypothetical protein
MMPFRFQKADEGVYTVSCSSDLPSFTGIKHKLHKGYDSGKGVEAAGAASVARPLHIMPAVEAECKHSVAGLSEN